MLRKLFSILAILLVSGHSLASNFVIGNMCFEVLDENEHTASLAVCWDKGETVDIPGYVEWKGQRYRVVEIATLAMRNCPSMKNLNIPQTCEKIKTTALYYSSKLEVIHVAEENAIYSDVDGVLFSKDQHTLYFYPQGRVKETYYVPNGVTTIADYAFFKNERLKTLHFPNSLMYIGQMACAGCHSLNNITLPENIAEVGSYAFYDCDSLMNVKVTRTSPFKLGEHSFSYLTCLNGELLLNGSAGPKIAEEFRKYGFLKVGFY